MRYYQTTLLFLFRLYTKPILKLATLNVSLYNCHFLAYTALGSSTFCSFIKNPLFQGDLTHTDTLPFLFLLTVLFILNSVPLHSCLCPSCSFHYIRDHPSTYHSTSNIILWIWHITLIKVAYFVILYFNLNWYQLLTFIGN
jgi:hypothetical protein